MAFPWFPRFLPALPGLLCVLLGLGCPSAAQAQDAARLSGQVLDQTTRQPLGFVSVGVLRQPYGTVADAQGRFTLRLPASYDADSVRFSLLGYAARTLRVADLRHTASVLLRAQAVPLAGVRVRAAGLKRRVLGNVGTAMRFDGFAANLAGNQMGQLLALKRPAFLEELSVRLFSCTYDTVYLRLNIYQLRNGYPADNIAPVAIYYQVSRQQAQETIYFDLRRYHLYLTENVVVALELVRSLGQGELWFRQPLAGGGPHYALEQTPGPGTVLNTVPRSLDSHDRKLPQPGGPWTRYPGVGVGISATLLELPE